MSRSVCGSDNSWVKTKLPENLGAASGTAITDAISKGDKLLSLQFVQMRTIWAREKIPILFLGRSVRFCKDLLTSHSTLEEQVVAADASVGKERVL